MKPTEKKKPGRKPGQKSGVKSSIDRRQPYWNVAEKLEHGIREWISLLRSLVDQYEALTGHRITHIWDVRSKLVEMLDSHPGWNELTTEKRLLVRRLLPIGAILHATEWGELTEEKRLLVRIEAVWSKYEVEHEKAVWSFDSAWFDRQEKAITGRYRRVTDVPNQGRFESTVITKLGSRARIFDVRRLCARGGYVGCEFKDFFDSLEKRREGKYLFVEGRRFRDERDGAKIQRTAESRAREEVRRLANWFGYFFTGDRRYRDYQQRFLGRSTDCKSAVPLVNE